MKCKDCIHYTAHKHFYFGEDEKDFDEYFNDDNVESQCPEFEDKKEWLKLPCKVGDKAYGLPEMTYKKIRLRASLPQKSLECFCQTSPRCLDIRTCFSRGKLPKRHSQKGAKNEQMH